MVYLQHPAEDQNRKWAQWWSVGMGHEHISIYPTVEHEVYRILPVNEPGSNTRLPVDPRLSRSRIFLL